MAAGAAAVVVVVVVVVGAGAVAVGSSTFFTLSGLTNRPLPCVQ